MEKLIESLNEYEKIREKLKEDEEQQYKREKSIIGEGVWRCDTFDTWEGDNIMSDVAPSYIISKSYGFIQWLVDNDKIDLDKLKDNISFTMLTHSIGLGCEWHTAHEGESILKAIGTNAIIAYLSIQDEPIEFLLSILK